MGLSNGIVITSMGIVIVSIFTLIFIFCDIKYLIYGTIIFMGFTGTSILNIKDSLFIQPIHFIGILLIIKTLIIALKRHNNNKLKISKLLLAFVVICGVSLLDIIYISGNQIVITPNSTYDFVKLGSQNFTQYIYLIFGYLVYLSFMSYFKNRSYDMDKIIKLLRMSFFIILLLGIIQIIVPVQVFNSLFRNPIHALNQGENGIVRISSATNEPSMFCLFTAPLTIFFYNSFRKRKKIIDLFLVFLGVATALLNLSSSYFVGITVYLVIVFIIEFLKFFVKLKNGSFKLKLIHVIFGMAIIIILCFAAYVFKDKIANIINNVVNKLSGDGISGSTRMSAFLYQINVFKKYFITGVGFGSVRSFDLLSTWLSEIGIIGFLPFVIYIIKNLRYLYINRKQKFNYELFGCILVTVVILFVSVPEPYFIYIWIYFSISDYYRLNYGER